MKRLNDLIDKHGDLEVYYRSDDVNNEIEVEITDIRIRGFEFLESDFEIN